MHNKIHQRIYEIWLFFFGGYLLMKTIGRYVILGNHRDAWTFGAADPNSGTACMLEVVSYKPCILGFDSQISL